MTEKYQSVNGAWPENVPALTAQEAVTAAKRLYRLGMGKPFKGKIKVTSGNRSTWIWNHTLHVNPNPTNFGVRNGWHELVHAMSHLCHRRLYPRHKPHDGRGTHAFIEKTMIEHVVNSGWLEGKLRRPEKPKPEVDARAVKLARIESSIKRWNAKQRRAENALRKLAKRQRYYQQAMAT